MTHPTSLPDATESILSRQASAVSQLPTEKKDHFLYLLDQLIDCYTTEKSCALVLFSEGIDDKQKLSLLAINADENQTEELIDNLCVFRQLDFSEDRLVLN